MNGRTVLITGASRGLGEYLAKRFWEAGYSLVLVARNGDALASVANSLEKRKQQTCILFPCDLGSHLEISKLIADVKARLPRLDVLIHNAAIHGPIGPLAENDLALWNAAMQINFLSPVALTQGLIPFLAQHGGGSIIGLSGGGATGPRANFSAYASSKVALVRFCETLSQETKSLAIRVNCIAPGAMKTALLGEVLAQGQVAAGEREFGIANQVFNEGGASMDQVAKLALFLAGNQSVGITGKLISAVWDRWEQWPEHLAELSQSDAYTLRRITGRERGFNWGDK